ncbi:MAG: acyltransferase [Erythrobacter sp.]|uniref:acyltransferase family protein n=1 Tax=Erythrobacter sp. TaxID=1042 RepID=UPI00329A37E8
MTNGPGAGALRTDFQQNASRRFKAVDGLRALAVALVFAVHGYFNVFRGGFIGVDIFFVISGFVITRSLVTDGINFKRFYIHRFFRILPPILPVLVFFAIANLFGLALASWQDIWLSLLSLMNWGRAFGYTEGGFLGHFWSLGIEEQFYLVWPFALVLLLKENVRQHSIVILAAVLAAFVLWQFWMSQQSVPHARIYNGLDTRASQLLLGALLFFVLPRITIPKAVFLAAVVALAVIVFTINSTTQFYVSYGIALIGILAFIVVGYCAQNTGGLVGPLEWPVTQWLGRRSYAIYLWHWPMIGLCVEAGQSIGARRFVALFVALVLTLVLSELSYRFVEKPAYGLRDRLDRKRLEVVPQ